MSIDAIVVEGDAAPPARRAALRGGLARRIAFSVGGLSMAMLVASGSLESAFVYREARAAMARQQLMQARAAAGEIEQYMQVVIAQLERVQALPWGQDGFGPDDRREELHRLLALSPAVVTIADFDLDGRERIAVSRVEADRVGDGRTPPPDATPVHERFGAPLFGPTGDPMVDLTLRLRAPGMSRTVARLNLRFLVDVLSGLRSDDDGEVFVVDSRDQLVAHADPVELLRAQNLKGHSLLEAVRRAMAAGTARAEAFEGPGLRGTRAVATAVVLPSTGWLLFVEQAHERAMQPVYAIVGRTLALMVLAVAAALLLSMAIARRLAAPIARLQLATAELAAGRLDTRLQLRTGDEIQDLADDFDTMADRLRRSHAELEHKVSERTAELARSLRARSSASVSGWLLNTAG